MTGWVAALDGFGGWLGKREKGVCFVVEGLEAIVAFEGMEASFFLIRAGGGA